MGKLNAQKFRAAMSTYDVMAAITVIITLRAQHIFSQRLLADSASTAKIVQWQ